VPDPDEAEQLLLDIFLPPDPTPAEIADAKRELAEIRARLVHPSSYKRPEGES
jgi:hypothetical protein